MANESSLYRKIGIPIPSAAAVVVTNGDEGATIASTNKVNTHPCQRDNTDKYNVIERSIISQIQAEQGGADNADTFRTSGQVSPLDKHIFYYKLPCKCGDGKIEVFLDGRGQTEHHTDYCRNRPGRGYGDPERQTGLGRQYCARIGAHAEESSMAQGNLAGIPDEKV